jgi:hypothetical protein
MHPSADLFMLSYFFPRTIEPFSYLNCGTILPNFPGAFEGNFIPLFSVCRLGQYLHGANRIVPPRRDRQNAAGVAFLASAGRVSAKGMGERGKRS